MSSAYDRESLIAPLRPDALARLDSGESAAALDRGLRQVRPGVWTWIGPAGAEPQEKEGQRIIRRHPDIISPDEPDARQGDDPGRISRTETHHDCAHRDRGGAGAVCRGLWRCAAELAHAGWTNPAVAAIGTLRRSERRSQSIEAKGSCTQAVVCRGSAEHRVERDTP